eukprot:3546041-Prymnesium_polylepis.1
MDAPLVEDLGADADSASDGESERDAPTLPPPVAKRVPDEARQMDSDAWAGSGAPAAVQTGAAAAKAPPDEESLSD